MSGVTYVYRMHPYNGKMLNKMVDHDRLGAMLAEGWYDSPSKVPDPETYREPEYRTAPEPSPAAAPLSLKAKRA